MEKKCVGIDVGGTSVKLGMFEMDGTLLEKWEILRERRRMDGTFSQTQRLPSEKRFLRRGFPFPIWLERVLAFQDL
ncbi:hypothetical protein CL3_03760 [butyrate-producing bacterium SM4/1]|nr:hypothetical protein CL3_03760 [butyrate-producing bacterium SM4/1]